MSDRLDQLVDAYLDGGIDAEGAVELARVARSRGPEAERIRMRIALTGLLGQALDPADSEAVVRGVDERLAAEAQGSAFARSVSHALDRRRTPSRIRPHARRRRAPWPAFAAAAMVAVAVAAGWLASGHRPAGSQGECRIIATEAPARLERAGASLPLAEGMVVRAGDRVVADGATALGYADGTRVDLAVGTRLAVLAGEAGKRLHLDTGAISADVAPQPAGRPLTVATPGARVEVVGTRFVLAADAARARLALSHGEVRFIRLSDQAGITVRAGESASVAAGEPFAAQPQPRAADAGGAPDIAVASSSAQPGWRALFPASGLDGWQQQHGSWQNADGVVRGSDPAGGKARLISSARMRDLELSCRLRIAGADHAEVQVGAYNWFFTVPARPGEWLALRLVQRGEELSCTVDGVELTPEAGDGAPSRSGELAFYVMPGGAIEIAAARIRVP